MSASDPSRHEGAGKGIAPDIVRSPADNPRLNSWKEIAAYLGCDERTAKRWEKMRGLPVHRLPGARSGVFAFEREINDWKAQGTESAAQSAGLDPDASDLDAIDPDVADSASGQPGSNGVAASVQTWVHQIRTYRLVGFSVGLLVMISTLLAFAHRSSTQERTVKISPQVSSLPVHVPSKEVEDIYLSGRYFWNRRTPSDLRQALGLFKQATERDPLYAPAYAGLADTYFLMVEFAGLPPRDAYPPAIAAARRAILLDSSMPLAHRSLAFSLFYWNWDREQAEKEFRKAIELDPHDATAHHWFANMLLANHRFQEALAEIEAARELDPSSISIVADRAHILQNVAGRQDEARDVLRRMEKTDPTFLSAHWYLAGLEYAQKEDHAYLEELRQIAAISHGEADTEMYRAARRGFAQNGEAGMSQAIAEAELRLYQRGLAPAFDVATSQARVGKTNEAIRYLKLAYLNRDTQFLVVTGEGAFPMLKDNIEFEQLAAKSLEPYHEGADSRT